MRSSEGAEPTPRPSQAAANRLCSIDKVEGRTFALELALAHGLGVVGVGAPAAVREFLVEAVAFREPGAIVVVVPAHDLADLLGYRSPAALPEPFPVGLEVTATLDDALDLLEFQALARSLRLSDRQPYQRWRPTFVLTALTARYDPARLQVVLDLGRGCGIAGLLLGSWRVGVTVSVGEDGRAGPADPGLSKIMRDVPLGGISAVKAADRYRPFEYHEILALMTCSWNNGLSFNLGANICIEPPAVK